MVLKNYHIMRIQFLSHIQFIPILRVNKCGILRYIGGKEIGDSTKRKISFKFNGKKNSRKPGKTGLGM